MEFLYPSLLLSVLTFILLFLLKLKKPKSHHTHPLPPGPWQLPIIGSIHHMLGALPHRILRELSIKHGPIMHLKLGEVSMVIVSSPNAVREIMKTHDVNFSSRPMMNVVKIISYGGKSLIFAPYGEYWRQIRKICVLELLSVRRVTSFHSIRSENAWAIGRDKRYWGEDAEEFRPERFQGSDVDYKGAHFQFLPFGAGRRTCPGMSFGVTNVEHALALLLCYFDWEVPAGGRPEDIDVEESFGATARKKNDLCLRAVPRIPLPSI